MMMLSSKAPPFEPSHGAAQVVRAKISPSLPGVGGSIIADKDRVTILQRPAGAGAPVPGSRKAAGSVARSKV